MEKQIYTGIRKAIVNDTLGGYLKQPQVKEITDNPYTGYCYVASEAFYHLVTKEISLNKVTYHPMFMKLPDDFLDKDSIYNTHWFIIAKENNTTPTNRIIDLTVEQFITQRFGLKSLPYHLAKGKGFLTKDPSKRAQKLIEAAQSIIGSY